ncbi:unnamed protein product [Danaus chrysippus]|uniref:(African queen) hypothetical protein n=1 Tax=Danaus chrysippus TaxID=151541 RepID=A0A8J2QZJ9_9NEOP|nr:unnamed protein product [Danaus chrysippus]
MEEDSPSHRAQKTTAWKSQKRPNVHPWPGQPPGMKNLIENVWHILQMNIAKRPEKPSNKKSGICRRNHTNRDLNYSCLVAQGAMTIILKFIQVFLIPKDYQMNSTWE